MNISDLVTVTVMDAENITSTSITSTTSSSTVTSQTNGTMTTTPAVRANTTLQTSEGAFVRAQAILYSAIAFAVPSYLMLLYK